MVKKSAGGGGGGGGRRKKEKETATFSRTIYTVLIRLRFVECFIPQDGILPCKANLASKCVCVCVCVCLCTGILKSLIMKYVLLGGVGEGSQGLHIWEEFWNVHLLMTGPDRPAMTQCRLLGSTFCWNRDWYYYFYCCFNDSLPLPTPPPLPAPHTRVCTLSVFLVSS